jgi:phage protein D
MADDLFYYVQIKAGSASYDMSRDIRSLTIEETSTEADMLTINLSDPYKVLSHAFQEGMEVEVDLGTVSDHSILFRGRVYAINSDFPLAGVPTLVLRAHDNRMRMGLKPRSRPWWNVTLTELVKKIVQNPDYKFQSYEVEVTGDPLFEGNGIRQHNLTDLDFLLKLARENACEMFVESEAPGDKLVFKSESKIMDADPQVTLYYGRCGVPNRLLTFQASGEVRNIRLPRVFSAMSDRLGQTHSASEIPPKAPETNDSYFDENLSALAKQDSKKADQLKALISAAPEIQQQLRTELGSVERVSTPTFATNQALQDLAKNQYNLSQLGMRANGSTSGNHRIHAQNSIGIADVGGRFSDKWYLSQVRHILDRQGYRTEFQCQR